MFELMKSTSENNILYHLWAPEWSAWDQIIVQTTSSHSLNQEDYGSYMRKYFKKLHVKSRDELYASRCGAKPD